VAFDDSLAACIRDALARKKGIEEKKMFGGVGFHLNGNMLVGVWKDSLIVRLGPDEGEEALREPHVREFDITGRPEDHRTLADGSCAARGRTRQVCWPSGSPRPPCLSSSVGW